MQGEKEKEKFYKETLQLLQTHLVAKAAAQDVIVVGMDANVTMNVEEDISWELTKGDHRKQMMTRATKQSRFLRNFMDKLDLADVWRQQHPRTRQYTISEERGKDKVEVSKRLDMILVNTKFTPMVTETNIRHDLPYGWLSDHIMTEVKLAGPLPLRDFSTSMYQKQTFDSQAIKAKKEQMHTHSHCRNG